MPDPWPHAPPHWVFSPGHYFITASTYHRESLLSTDEKRDVVQGIMLDSAASHGWQMRAWVILSNHYHMLVHSPEVGGESLGIWLCDFHRTTAGKVNEIDKSPRRRVWMNYRDSLISHQSHQTSYLERLNYIHQNPVKHGLVATAEQYPWSSYRWFITHASSGLAQSVSRFGSDHLNVWDDF